MQLPVDSKGRKPRPLNSEKEKRENVIRESKIFVPIFLNVSAPRENPCFLNDSRILKVLDDKPETQPTYGGQRSCFLNSDVVLQVPPI